MESCELMMGNWVEVILSDHLKYVKVVEIYGKSVLVKDGNDEWEPEEINIVNIKAIPLTEEILLANGFVVSKHQSILEDVGACFLYGKYERIVEDGWTIVGDLRHPIKYVHELQQALRLCSIEKEIKLNIEKAIEETK